MKRTTLLITFILACCSIFAQSEITGRVTDARDGTALAGVTVSVKGGNTITTTDENGNFRINAPRDAILVFSSIGFTDVEVRASDASTVVLQVSQRNLQEVVVTGYTTQTRRQATASVSRISGESVKLQPIASFDQLLQGKAPGVLIQSQSGQPGSPASNITIRGKGSVLASTQPLFIVDGIQVTGADFQSINPGDIESYNVLKDAVATSQYGSRGANGVIVVTTKRGANAKTNVNYDFQYGIGQLPKNKLRLMNSFEKIHFELNYDHPYGQNFYQWTDAEADSLSKVYADWEGALFRKGKTQQHILSMSGGNDRTKFFLSGSVFDQEGTVISTGLRRYTGRINIDHNVNNFRIGLTTFFGSSEFHNTFENNEFIGSPLNALRWANPYVTPYLPDGSYNRADLLLQGQPHAVEELVDNPFTNKQLKAIAGASIEYRFPGIRGLSVRTQWGVDFTNDDNSRYIAKHTYLGSQQTGTQGSFSQNSLKRVRYTGTTSISYGRQAGDHNFRASLFNEMIERKTSSFGYTGFGLLGIFRNGADITPGTPTNGYIPTIADVRTETSILSYFAIGDYSFRNKYFVNGSFRYDGSSRLAEGNQWVGYGGVGVGWLISAEDFMRDSRSISELKLKASYGSAGNENVGDSYEAREQYVGTTYNGIGGVVLTNLEKPDLSWEVRQTLNIGIDYGFFRNRLTGTIEVYNATTKGLYLNRQLSGTNGVNSILTNLGRIRNQGIEFSIAADVISNKNFVWQVAFNHTYNRSKVLELDGTEQNVSGRTITKVGERLNSIYLVRYAGVDSDNGNALYYTADGKDLTDVYDPNDKVIVGTFDPPHFGGFTNVFTYRGFELSAQFNYMFGHKIFNVDRVNVENPAYVISGVSADLLREWQEQGDVTDIPSPFSDFQANTTRFLESGDFLRLRNLTVSYTLPSSLLKQLKLSSIRMFVQGQNLATWHKFKGYDPEVATGDLTGAQYPQLKVVTFGVNVGF